MLAEKCNISIRQLTNWFTNGRKRIWIPLRRQEGRRIVPYLQARAVQVCGVARVCGAGVCMFDVWVCVRGGVCVLSMYV